ncbi:Histidine kinase [Burkholderiales bacterium 8X]|nr:Histidine kinase [Burkholderiales bacterium 8X]
MAMRPVLADYEDHQVFSSLFTAYPDGLLLVDGMGNIAAANPAARELLGYATGDELLIGMSVDALVPENIRPRHAAYRDGYVASPRSRPMGTQMDLVARRRDGSEVQVEISLSPLQRHGLPFTVAAIRAVGDYPRVRQAIQRARYAEFLAAFGRLAVEGRELQELIDRLPSIAAEALQVEMAKILMLDAGGTRFRIAAGVGLLPDEVVGGHVANEPGSPAHHVVTKGESLVIADYAAERRFHIPRPYLDAGLVCEASVPLKDRERVIGTLAVRSKTPKRFGNDELRFLESLSSLLVTVLQRASSEEALRHAQRLESVGQLTGGIAHDFNNLLTIISGNLQVLEDLPSHAGDPAALQLVNAALRATRRAADLTGKLLAFSRRQVLQPAMVDVGALLRSLTDMLRRTLDQRIAITLVAPTDMLCLADPVQLESALLNIAINARDAMHQGGTLSFAVRRVERLPHGWQDDALPPTPGGHVAIDVRDTGEGMSEAVVARAFEPFFTTKDSGRGTGLGLSTVYGFARQSHGAVSLQSSLGGGTVVTLYLPRVDAGTEEGDAAQQPWLQELPAGLRVLLVEDDVEVRRVAERFLENLRCKVTACADASEAAHCFGDGSGFDLLLTDVVLGPGARGTALAARLRSLKRDLPVLLVSGYASELPDDASQWRLLRKPYQREELATAIGRALLDARSGPPGASM